jgi:ABC-type nitrate/sulfonate/bicarbonate transport system substrate-binding protein
MMEGWGHNRIADGMACNSRPFVKRKTLFSIVDYCLVVFSFFLLIGPAVWSDVHAQKPPQTEKVTFATPAIDAGFLPLFVAAEKKFFRDEGIEAQIVHIKADVATKALVTGDVDYSAAAGSVARAAAAGMPLKVVLYTTRLPAFFLIAQPKALRQSKS